jgi:hypothetical protein
MFRLFCLYWSLNWIFYLQRYISYGLYHVLLFGAAANVRKATISFVTYFCPSLHLSVRTSVRPNGTTQLPLDGILWNLIFEYFSKICRENSNFFKIWKEWLFYIWTNIHWWSYSVHFFLEGEEFPKSSREIHTTHFIFKNIFQIRAFYKKMWKKYCTAG